MIDDRIDVSDAGARLVDAPLQEVGSSGVLATMASKSLYRSLS